jgi:hypothetical protein
VIFLSEHLHSPGPSLLGGFSSSFNVTLAIPLSLRVWVIEQLKSNTTTTDEKREALRFVIHFVADIHQPLHCANNNDRGGNDIPLRWGNRKTNLHEIWDHYVLTNTLNQVTDSTSDGSVVHKSMKIVKVLDTTDISLGRCI